MPANFKREREREREEKKNTVLPTIANKYVYI